MKRGLVGLDLCDYISLAALFGDINANTIHDGVDVGPQCDLPPVLVEQ